MFRWSASHRIRNMELDWINEQVRTKLPPFKDIEWLLN
jgi:hypothetical protein